MGCRVLYDATDELACLYDSTTGVAFGPVFESLEDSIAGESLDAQDAAESFLQWCMAGEDGEYVGDPLRARATNPGSPGLDPRRLVIADLMTLAAEWVEWRRGGDAPRMVPARLPERTG